MAIDVLGIDHCVLRVSDLARSLRFYGEVLGAKTGVVMKVGGSPA